MVSAGGQPALVPGALLLVNLLAVVAIAFLAARLARGLGRSPWWGAVPALWAGYVVGVGQDLTEPLAGALLLAALCAMRAGRFVPAAVALTAAALTRETTLVLAVAVLLASLVTARGSPSRAAAVVGRRRTPGRLRRLAHLGARTLVGRGSRPAFRQPAGTSGLELVRLPRATPPPTSAASGRTSSCWCRRSRRSSSRPLPCGTATGRLHERLALAGYLVLLLCLPVWDRGQAYLRWGCEPILLGWLLLVLRRPAVRPRVVPAVAGLVAVAWLAAVAVTYDHPGPEHWVPADGRTDQS